jgi:preprotein translocase subunit SecE
MNMETNQEQSVKRGIFARILLFVNEIIDEMRKVVYPTRKETVTYVIVVLAFVTVIMLLITFIDVLIGYGVTWLFA